MGQSPSSSRASSEVGLPSLAQKPSEPQRAPSQTAVEESERPVASKKKKMYRLTVRGVKSLQQRKRVGQRGSGRLSMGRRNSRKRREMTALTKSWHVVADDLEMLGLRLFERVLRTYPDLVRGIAGLPEMAPVTPYQILTHPRSRQHARRVMETIGMVVDSYGEFDKVRPLLVMLGRHHGKHGVTGAHLQIVRDAFLSLMKERLADSWGSNLHEAWSNLFSLIYEAMLVGVEQRRSIDTLSLTREFNQAQRSVAEKKDALPVKKKNSLQPAKSVRPHRLLARPAEMSYGTSQH